MDPVFDLITAVLAWFYQVWPSYGMSIVFLTVCVMIVMTPLTIKNTRTMMQMQLLAPELKKIQKKYRHDRAEMNKAQMEFYKEHNLNPMGGCLPILVQAPIFLVLYRVVTGLTRRATQIGTQLGYTTSQFALEQELGGDRPYQTVEASNLKFDPDFLKESTELYKNLSTETEMVSWGIDLSRSASTAMNEGIVEGFPYIVMIALVLVTSLYQQRQIKRRSSNSSANQMQQTIMKVIPYTLPIISYSIPAAVVVYFIVSSLSRIGQQYYIGRSFYSGEESLGAQLARQRKLADGKKASSPKEKKTDANQKKKAKAPLRSSRSSDFRKSRTSSSSRSGKAPVRTLRNSSTSGRVTSAGSKAKHNSPNRSKKKRKRR